MVDLIEKFSEIEMPNDHMEATFFNQFDVGFETVFAERVGMVAPDQPSGGDLTIYTDGSKMKGCTGARNIL